MDVMDEHDDVALNVKAILLAAGGAALAAWLFVMSRQKEEKTPLAHAEAAVKETTKDARKAAERAAKDAKKKAKKTRKEVAETVSDAGERIADRVRDTAADVGIDTKALERDLKAAAWDAQQEAREAENRLRAAGLRMVDDAAHLASRVGAEARNLAGEGKERIAHLRHREEPESEIDRLRDELDELRARLEGSERRGGRDYRALTSRLAGKTGPIPDAVASEAAAAALAHLERSLKTKVPALITAKNRGQVLEILQQELGPTLKESAAQAVAAAFSKWDAARERADESRERGREAADDAAADLRHMGDDVEASAREAAAAARDKARKAEEAVARHAEESRLDGMRRLWRANEKGTAPETVAEATEAIERARSTGQASEPEEEQHGKAGLLWGGAGLGLALFALLDPERRDKMLRLANEASIQVQELVRDLQGYDDEF
jgi:hypothetical protein